MYFVAFKQPQHPCRLKVTQLIRICHHQHLRLLFSSLPTQDTDYDLPRTQLLIYPCIKQSSGLLYLLHSLTSLHRSHTKKVKRGEQFLV